jgi:hypothetical protein
MQTDLKTLLPDIRLKVEFIIVMELTFSLAKNQIANKQYYNYYPL